MRQAPYWKQQVVFLLSVRFVCRTDISISTIAGCYIPPRSRSGFIVFLTYIFVVGTVPPWAQVRSPPCPRALVWGLWPETWQGQPARACVLRLPAPALLWRPEREPPLPPDVCAERPAPLPFAGKPRGINAARKLRTVRRQQRWAQKRYKKAHLGTQFKCNPFGGSSHCKGIVLEKMWAAALEHSIISVKGVQP